MSEESKFCYYTRPLSGQQRFTGQAKYRGTRSSEEVVAALVQRSGLTKPQVENLLAEMGKYLVEQSMDCWRVAPVMGYFGFRATCGGSEPDPDFAPTFGNLDIRLRSQTGKLAKTYAESLFKAEGLGHQGLAAPEFVRVLNSYNGIVNTYTPGKSIQIDLKENNCTLDPSVTTQGVFFTAANGTRVRSTDYGYRKGCVLICGVPLGLTGAQELSVTLQMNGGVRTGLFNTPLTLMTSEEEDAPPSAPRQGRRKGETAAKDLALPS